MAKRLGANSRKKYADRKVKVRGAAKKIALKVAFTLCIGATGVALCFGGFKGVVQLVKTVKESNAFNVTAVNIEGNSHVELKNVLDKCGLDGKSKTYSIKESAVREALMFNPWIENVNVIKSFGGQVKIKIQERKPVALVNLHKIYYIDRSGVLFPMPKKVISEMPVLYGLKDTVDSRGIRRVRSSDMKRVNSFMNEALAVNDDFFQSITQIDFSDKEKIRLSFQAYSTIVELSGKNLDMKLRQLIQLENELQGESSMPEKINMSYQNLAFVTVSESLTE